MQSFRLFIYILAISFLTSCSNENEQVDRVLNMAGENRMELEKVLNHYVDNPQKYSAAKWLIINMPGHSAIWSNAIQAFSDSIMRKPLSHAEGNKLWDSLKIKNPSPKIQMDIESLNSDFLIDNIDKAFDAWENAPWHDEIDFETFKKYILPYRIDKEILRAGWRDSLSKTYLPLIKTAKTAREAYEKIRKKVNSMRTNGRYNFPYIMDPVALQNNVSGICIERCIYLASICRSVGLPVSIDNCGKWANYSDNTHSWVALILPDGTYTIIDNDSVSKKFNTIDASTFKLEKRMPCDYPYSGNFKKRLLKVWRQTFDINTGNTPKKLLKGAERLTSSRLIDVSKEYGINGSVSINSNFNIDYIWICTYAISQGWIPQAYSKAINGQAIFENISDSVIMLPMAIVDSKEIPIGNPFYIVNGRKIEIIPDKTRTTSAIFTRKYPLNAGWLTRYSQIPGTRFEGSNDFNFTHADTIFTINHVPVFYNSSIINSNKAFRYIRVIAEPPIYANMDHITIYDKFGKILASEKKRSFDLKKPHNIGRIDYFPWNDGNFIIPNHIYELNYWNHDHWESLGKKRPNDYNVQFGSIPCNALLILNDLTEGKEERPFTLQNGKQIWW